ncbi:hypothetical protein EV421DRAFT_1736133 [Armillaria borealis]|uniref:Uncharacterized protein n=1 Tax=Armillaria borealis TaxID=47425 RepID=A0AA39JHN3_9AGAR|nr:hypothetical protein EV421DRAFT_1736133 [Armillaria borealis]
MSWVFAKGVKSVVCLALSAVINIFVPKPAFYVHRSIGRQPFFEGDKTKQKFRGMRGKAILDEALRRFGVQVWWSGACMLTISGFDAAGNMVFTAELANRLVDSAAWVYTANQTKETFDTNDYARVIPPGRINSLVVRKLSCTPPPWMYLMFNFRGIRSPTCTGWPGIHKPAIHTRWHTSKTTAVRKTEDDHD